jgi:prepilin-type N-terminal cleavage/methylation domain-containing protein
MSLIELLVVISIIGVLAGLILPAVGNVKKKAKIVQAQKDMADIKGAISVYQNDYHRLPASSAAAGVGSDFTYGTTATGYNTNIVNNNGAGHQASNAELMLILTAATSFPNYTTNNANQNNAKNPRRTPYFNAKPAPGGAGANAGPGLGTDGVMRDPWGSPYIIALDLNYDGWVSNSVYRLNAVNAFNTGLSRQGAVGTDTWALKDSAMIFSFGGDGMFDSATAAGTEPNKDNVLSWK